MTHPLLTLAMAAVLGGVTASAHHSFAAYYFENQSTTIEGEIEEFQLRSPHALVLFKARTPEGTMETYTAEWGNPRRLSQNGITKDTLKPGDFVVITGSPGRTPSERKVHLKGIRRPADGWSFGTANPRTSRATQRLLNR
jgi:hypothetical protein